MAKYIIELEDEPMVANSSHQEVDELWKAKGFNSLVFDKCGLDKLTPYIEPDCNAIADEVWKFLVFLIDEMDADDKYECFGLSSSYGIVRTMSYQEAKNRYEAWEKQKNGIHVGDEIVLDENVKMIVTRVDHEAFIQGVDENGECYECIECNAVRKTGRHFDWIKELLKKMRDAE